jgi:micrococcal nuclease
MAPTLVAALAGTIGLAQDKPGVSAPAAVTLVERVVDGDTVVVRRDGQSVKVRLIGVDARELVDPRKPVERFGHESAVFLGHFVEGKRVRLAYEPAGARIDRYGRTLAYLHVEPGGPFVNREIIARGYGHAYVKYPFRHMDDFRAAERTAREQELGLWTPGNGPGAGGPNPVENAPAGTTVYVTRTGTKYHRAGCRSLAKSSTAIPLEKALEKYTPCAICDPPGAIGRERR